MCAPSVAEPGAALGAAAGQNLTAIAGGHALAEAMDLGTLALLGLIVNKKSARFFFHPHRTRYCGFFSGAAAETALH